MIKKTHKEYWIQNVFSPFSCLWSGGGQEKTYGTEIIVSKLHREKEHYCIALKRKFPWFTFPRNKSFSMNIDILVSKNPVLWTSEVS